MKFRFNIIDKKFKSHVGQYLFQCFLATLTILAVLIFLDILTETAIITALGASAFIVFTMPKMYTSEPRRLIGGYFVGLLVGFIFFGISKVFSIIPFFSETMSLVIFGALAVGAAIFIMVVTNTEHAPAAGIALGLVINNWDHITIIFIICAIIWMSVLRKILKPIMMDLT